MRRASFAPALAGMTRQRGRPCFRRPARRPIGRSLTSRRPAGDYRAPGAFAKRIRPIMVRAKLIVALAGFVLASCASGLRAQEAADALIGKLVPELEAYIRAGMKAFDDPGLAIGIVAATGWSMPRASASRRKGGEPVDTRPSSRSARRPRRSSPRRWRSPSTARKFAWDDRVVDLDSGLPAQGPLGDARVPDVRSAWRSARGCRPTATISSACSAPTSRR